eukprot:4655646-Amphidinium_carterae.1
MVGQHTADFRPDTFRPCGVKHETHAGAAPDLAESYGMQCVNGLPSEAPRFKAGIAGASLRTSKPACLRAACHA